MIQRGGRGGGGGGVYFVGVDSSMVGVLGKVERSQLVYFVITVLGRRCCCRLLGGLQRGWRGSCVATSQPGCCSSKALVHGGLSESRFVHFLLGGSWVEAVFPRDSPQSRWCFWASGSALQAALAEVLIQQESNRCCVFDPNPSLAPCKEMRTTSLKIWVMVEL